MKNSPLRHWAIAACVMHLINACTLRADDESATFVVIPEHVQIVGPFDQQRIIVRAGTADASPDHSRRVSFEINDPSIARVSSEGVIQPIANGHTKLNVSHNNQQVAIPVVVTEIDADFALDFERDIVPIFSRRGCNSGPCHGKARGQNGFQLSLFGFDPEFDYDALAKEARGRRVFIPDVERSLLIEKATGTIPHGGGIRFAKESNEAAMLLQWIRTGLHRRRPQTAQLTNLTITPDIRVMQKNEEQQFLVTAHYDDGRQQDVTHLAAFQSNESAIAAVDDDGLVTAGTIIGEAAIMARYRGMIAVANVPIPQPESVPADKYEQLPRYNFIDELVWNQLQRLGILPSDLASDDRFLRRAYIDIIGRAPTVEESRDFLSTPATRERREQLVDHLLAQPEYASHWANKWVDLLRPNPYRVGIKTVMNFDVWIRNAFRENWPYDKFVRELITAQGGTWRNGAVTLFRDRRSPDELTTSVSQLFLGIRLECAKCHHHPFEVWGQDDFYSFAAYFARVGRKGTGLSPPISGSEEFIFSTNRGSVKHPLTGQVLPPRPLFGSAPEVDEQTDPRRALAAWMTSGENPFFGQVMANRVWVDLMGRGLVEPVDDIRDTNPPTNKPLLEALGRDFAEQKYDLKQLIRRITTSYVYALGSIPNETSSIDTRYYSRHYRQRLRAEVLLDTVSTITGVPEKFAAMPPGSKAKELWTHRISSNFLDAFGRPDPNQDPPCERTSDTTVVQTLHLMNSDNLYAKVTHKSGRAKQLADGERPPTEIADELYLSVYSRFPTDEERVFVENYLTQEGENRQQAVEDLMWALLNTPEFLFKD